MKTVWSRAGDSYNKLTAYFLSLCLAVAIIFSASAVEAKASIYFEFVNVTTEPGCIKIHGYFYNKGNPGARVTKMHFRGNVDGCDINCMFNDPGVGYIEAYGSKNFTFTITDRYYRYYKSNPPWNLHYNVTFN